MRRRPCGRLYDPARLRGARVLLQVGRCSCSSRAASELEHGRAQQLGHAVGRSGGAPPRQTSSAARRPPACWRITASGPMAGNRMPMWPERRRLRRPDRHAAAGQSRAIDVAPELDERHWAMLLQPPARRQSASIADRPRGSKATMTASRLVGRQTLRVSRPARRRCRPVSSASADERPEGIVAEQPRSGSRARRTRHRGDLGRQGHPGTGTRPPSGAVR